MKKTKTLTVFVPPRACLDCGGDGCARCTATDGYEPTDKPGTWHNITVDEHNTRVHVPAEAAMRTFQAVAYTTSTGTSGRTRIPGLDCGHEHATPSEAARCARQLRGARFDVAAFVDGSEEPLTDGEEREAEAAYHGR